MRDVCEAVRSFSVAAAVLAASACTRVSDRERFTAQGDAIAIAEAIPTAGRQDVATDVQIDLCFSAYLDPRSVGSGDATLTSGVAPIDIEVALQILPWRGPGNARLVDHDEFAAPWCEGSVVSISPRAELLGGLLYRLRLVPRARGWAGEALDTETPGWTVEGSSTRYYHEFRTRDDGGADTGVESGDDADTSGGDEGGTTTRAESGDDGAATTSAGSSDDGGAGDGEDGTEPPTLAELFAPGNLFDPNRDTCSCHRDPHDVPGQLLDLRTPDAAYADLVLGTRPRDTGFPMVSPRRPSESFLIHKLLRNPDGSALHGLLGDAMPQGGTLPYADFVAVARWIEGGAQR